MASSTSHTQLVPFEWAVPASQSAETRADLSASGAELAPADRPFEPSPEDRDEYARAAFEPLMIIAGAMGIMLLAERVAQFVRDVRHDGLIVDTRQGKLEIRPHPALEARRVLVVSDDGTQEFDGPAGADVASVIAALRATP